MVNEYLRGVNEVMLNDVAYVCWQIWKVRCEMVMEKRQISVEEAISRTKWASKEFYSLKWNLIVNSRKKEKGFIQIKRSSVS